MTYKISRVETGVIEDGAVTNDKLADMTSVSVKANPEITDGPPQDVRLSSNHVLARISDQRLESSQVLTAMVADAAIIAVKLAPSSVTTAKVVDKAITNDKMADMPFGSVKANVNNAGSQVPTDYVLPTQSVLCKPSITNTIAGQQLLSNQVLANTGTILEGSQVKTAMVEDLAITSDKIAAQAVGNTKLTFMAAATVKANPNGFTSEPADVNLPQNQVLRGEAGNQLVASLVIRDMIEDKAVSNPKLADSESGNAVKARVGGGAGVWSDLAITGDTLLGRLVGNPVAALTATQVRTLLNVEDGANNYAHPNHTGDVASVGDGATTIQPKAVTNAMLADAAQTASIKSYLSGAGWLDVSTQANSVLVNQTGATLFGLQLQADSTVARSGSGAIGQLTASSNTVFGRFGAASLLFNAVGNNRIVGRGDAGLGALDPLTVRKILGLATALEWRQNDTSVDINQVTLTTIPYDTLLIEIDPDGVIAYATATDRWTFSEVGIYEYTGQVVYLPSNPNQVQADIQVTTVSGVGTNYGYQVNALYDSAGTTFSNIFFTGIIEVTSAPFTFTIDGTRGGGNGTAFTIPGDTLIDFNFTGGALSSV